MLYPYICDIVKGYNNLSEKVAELSGLKIGTIRIGTFSSVACHWMPALVSGFQSRYPGIKFDILQGTYAEIEAWINNGIVDLGFVSKSKIKGMDIVSVCSDPLMVILPYSHPYASCETFPIRQIANEPFIYISDGDDDVYHKLFREHDIKPDIKYYVKDDYSVMAMVERGIGIGMLPRLVMERTPYHILQKPTFPLYSRQLGIAMKDKNKLSPATKRFLRYFQEQLSSDFLKKEF